MPTPLTLPFPPLLIVSADAPIEPARMLREIRTRAREGVSICVRMNTGVDDRGGYFFHIRQVEDAFDLINFERHTLHQFESVEALTAFVNHATGLQYNEQAWQLARALNLRTDEQTV